MILDDIAERTRERVAELKQKRPESEICAAAKALKTQADFPFEAALCSKGLSFICEVKRASPTQGIIAEDFPYLKIAKDYEQAGAAAISVLTEPYWFHGQIHYLAEIAEEVEIPVLRKDFIVDSYQIYESKLFRASAILLICALLPTGTLREYLQIAHELGLSCLVEAHSEAEVKSALAAGARVIGVNNRNLKTMEVDLSTSLRLRGMVPPELLFVSESGIKTPEDVAALKKNHTDAVLIGESLMRSPDKKAQLERLRGESSYSGESSRQGVHCL